MNGPGCVATNTIHILDFRSTAELVRTRQIKISFNLF